jgi:hypothetical protein
MLLSHKSMSGTGVPRSQQERACPFRPFSPFLIGVSEGRCAKSPTRRHFRAVASRDKRSKAEGKRRENGALGNGRRTQHGSTAVVGMAKIDERIIGHE